MWDYWVRDVVCAGLMLSSFILGYVIARRRTRRDIVGTFNEIIMTVYRLAWSQRYDELNGFLEELTNDKVPYVPDSTEPGKIIRPNKKPQTYNE
jgi:hypothetical protein